MTSTTAPNWARRNFLHPVLTAAAFVLIVLPCPAQQPAPTPPPESVSPVIPATTTTQALQPISESPSKLEITTATTQFAPGFRGELERIVAGHGGIMGITVKNLKTGETIAINGDEPFPTASTIKLAVMTTAMDRLARGLGPFKNYYDTKVYDATTSSGGAGLIQNYRKDVKLELKELIHLMITVSDNIATNMVTQWLGGPEVVNQWLEANGFPVTRMHSGVGGHMIAIPEGRKTWGLGVTTTNEMARLMEAIITGRAGTTSTTDEMTRVLGHQYFDSTIAAQVPPTVWVGSKSGAVNESRSDVAAVASPAGTYILSIFTKRNADRSWKNDNEAELAIQKISRAVYKHYNPSDPWQPPPGQEEF